MDRFYGYNTCTANITYIAQNEKYTTHTTIAEYLHSINVLENITCIQISTCYRYLSICFQNRNLMAEFCQNEHDIIEYTITFYQDYQKRLELALRTYLLSFLMKNTTISKQLRNAY